MATPSDLIAALTLTIDHYVSGVVVAGTAAKTDQHPVPGLIKSLSAADAANTTALAAITTAQSTDPTPAHNAWAASVAPALAAKQRAERAVGVGAAFAVESARVAAQAFDSLMAREPPATVFAAVAIATAAQQVTQATLTAEITAAQQYLAYLSVP